MAGRGMLTPVIRVMSVALLGREISQAELRLMPYVQHCAINSQAIDPNRLNAEERGILCMWRAADWIEGGAAGMSIGKPFWNAALELIWLGYVDHEAQRAEAANPQLLEDYLAYLARQVKGGETQTFFACPHCGGLHATRAAGHGVVWDTLATCPYCSGLFRKVVRHRHVETLVPPAVADQ